MQVAFQQLVLLQRGVLAVQTALHIVANDKSHAPAAVVGAAAVVVHPAPELGEHQQGHIVAGVVLPQVVHKIGHRVGSVRPQLGVGRQFARVGVKAVVGRRGVQNARAEAGQMHLGNVLHILPHHIAAVLHAGAVHLGGGAENVGPLQGVHSRLGQVVHYGAAPDGGRVNLGENVQGVAALRFGFNPGEHAVGGQVAHGGHGNAGGGQGPGQSPPEIDAGQHIFLVRVQLADGAPQPALGALLVRLAGMPDVHAAEVAPVRVAVPHPLDDGNLAFIVQPLHRPHIGIETHIAVQVQRLAFGHPHRGPVVVIQRVAVRHQRVEGVIAAGELEHHQHRVFLGSSHFDSPCGSVSLPVRAVGCRL